MNENKKLWRGKMSNDFVCIGYYSEMDPKCYLCPDVEKCKDKTTLRKIEKELKQDEIINNTSRL